MVRAECPSAAGCQARRAWRADRQPTAAALPAWPQEGAFIKAQRGNRAQWHANFRLDEFVATARDLCVLQEGGPGGAPEARGLLVIGPGHTLADTYKMLLTEHQLCPTSGTWRLSCVASDGTVLTVLSDAQLDAEVLPLLPEGSCELLVGNCPPPCYAALGRRKASGA